MKQKTSQFIQEKAYTDATVAYSSVVTAWVWTELVQTHQQGGQTRRDQ
jgi:hypothetical protein